MADLLEHLERPDNLVQYQIVKEIKFNNEHRSKLAEVESAINPDVVPVTDSAVSLRVEANLFPPFRNYSTLRIHRPTPFCWLSKPAKDLST